MKKRSHRAPVPATNSGPSPADYPLGSPQSRAAARARLPVQPGLTRDDIDCMNLCAWHTAYIDAGTDPDYEVFGATAAARRGEELLAPGREWVRSLSDAELEDLAGLRDERAELEEFIAAWQRQIPGLQCPVRLEGNLVLHHLTHDGWREVKKL